MPDMIAGHLSESPGPSTGCVQYLLSHIFYVLLRRAACGFTCVYVGVLGAPLSEASSSTRVQEERQIARHVLLCLLLIVCMLAVRKTNTQLIFQQLIPLKDMQVVLSDLTEA